MPDMIKTVSEGDGKSSLGIKLERALPDIYWANFLGPEYVDMFGREKLESTPATEWRYCQMEGPFCFLRLSPLTMRKTLMASRETSD